MLHDKEAKILLKGVDLTPIHKLRKHEAEMKVILKIFRKKSPLNEAFGMNLSSISGT